MNSTLTLPFQLARAGTNTPVTKASEVDIDTISSIESTTVQEALEELASNSKIILSNASNISQTLLKVNILNSIVQSLLANGISNENTYGFIFMEEADMDNLTAETMVENVFYCGLEADETEPSTDETHATYANGYVMTGGTYSNGYVLVSGTYSNGYVNI